jgi:hypothetical protein
MSKYNYFETAKIELVLILTNKNKLTLEITYYV